MVDVRNLKAWVYLHRQMQEIQTSLTQEKLPQWLFAGYFHKFTFP